MNIKSLVALTLVLGSSAGMAECVNPKPPSIPDGASSTMPQMIEGQGAVKTFQASNIEYMACLEKVFNDAEAAGKEAPEDEKAAAAAIYDKALAEYNDAVSKEEAVASQFNKEIGAFKTANPS